MGALGGQGLLRLTTAPEQTTVIASALDRLDALSVLAVDIAREAHLPQVVPDLQALSASQVIGTLTIQFRKLRLEH